MVDVKIKVYNTYVSISSSSDRLGDILRPVAKYLTSYQRLWNNRIKKFIFKPDREWFHYDEFNNTFFIPISMFTYAYNVLKNNGVKVMQEDLEIIRDIEVEPMKGFFRNDKFTLRDYQDAYQEAITSEGSKLFSLVDLKTGAGKTLISFYCITKLGLKTGIVLLPRYIEKWIEDVSKYTTIDPNRVYVVQGRESLSRLLSEPTDKYDIIIFSMTTLDSYIKSGERNEEGVIPPYDIFNRLKIGILLSDESHQALGALSKIIMYSNVKKVIGLSATFIHSDEEDKKFKHMVFPESTRISNIVKFNSHIDAYSCPYKISPNVRVKDKQQKMYSHVVFEQSVMGHHLLLKDYIDMIDYYVEVGYLKRRKSGQKCLIFFSTINMCTYVYNFMKKKYPKLKIRRYVGEDDYDTMQEGDIIISTLGSFGTALETSNLITVIHTVCLRSPIGNIQSAGRLRKIEGVKTELYSLWCSSLSTHTQLQKNRENVLKGVVTLWKSKPYSKVLPVIKFKKKNIFAR